MNMHPALSPDFNPPPPTFNTLDSQQKTRLIRTTRKLGAVLGTTPHFAESISPVAFSPPRPLPIGEPEKPLSRPLAVAPKNDRRRRQGSIFEFSPPSKPFAYEYASSSSASSSAASLALPRSSTDSSNSDASTQSLPTPRSFARHVREKSKGTSKRAPLPTPLVLRLNAVALPPSDPRLATPPSSGATLHVKNTTTTAAGAGSGGSAPNSGNRTPMPVTPTTPGTPATPTVTETRRKRLAKLKRTLGENVPAELVIPTPRATHPRRLSPLEGPSGSGGALAPFPLMSAPQTQADRPYPANQSQNQSQGRSQSAHAKPPPRTQKTYPFAYAAPSSSSPERAGMRTSPRKRSVSVDFKRGFMSPPVATSAPAAPKSQPQLQLQPQRAEFQPQTQSQSQIRRAPSLSARRAPAWTAARSASPPERYGSPDSGSGSGSEQRRSRKGKGNGQGWATGGTSWMGEWNRKDIHEVQRQLRNLKLR